MSSPRVVAALRTLTGHAGDVMNLYFRGVSDRHIAASLGISRSAVWQLRRRTMNRLRRTADTPAVAPRTTDRKSAA